MKQVIVVDQTALVGLARHLRVAAEGIEKLSRLIAEAANAPAEQLGLDAAVRDSVAEFLNERCRQDKNAETGSLALYREFRRWAAETGASAITHKLFSRSLVELGLPKRRAKTGYRYRGLVLHCQEQLAAEGSRGY